MSVTARTDNPGAARSFAAPFLFFLVLLTVGCAQHRAPIARQHGLPDSTLKEVVQRQTFRFFWDYAHPVSGMTRDRITLGTTDGSEVVTSGGTGFGVMAVIVAVDRGWVTRDSAMWFLHRLTGFLSRSDRFHGAFPHWMDGATGKVIPFSDHDDGAELVETAYLMEGLICARQYFNDTTTVERELRSSIDSLWSAVEWDWFTRGGKNMLYWHWSPKYDWAMDMPVRGFNECLITYVLAAADGPHRVAPAAYHEGWTDSPDFRNGKKYYDMTLPLGPAYGGPLFFSHYSFLGIDPRGLKDRYADYWEQNRNHARINREYCIRNPKQFKGYGEKCWGLTASDTYDGYTASSPTEDVGTIAPTAALSSFPYTPNESMQVLRHLYEDLGDELWSEYGFVDAFNPTKGWTARTHLAIDQGPIIVMMENERSGLLWRLFMSSPQARTGLTNLGFTSPALH